MFAIPSLRLLLACAAGLAVPCALAAPQPAPAAGLLAQAEHLPAEFRDHFFDVPLAVRLDLDGRYLADAMLLLGRDGTVQVLNYTSVSESEVAPAERDRWLENLGTVRPLGACQQACPDGLLAVHYSLERSVLGIVTTQAEAGGSAQRYYTTPENSRGVLLRNQFNAAGSRSAMYGTFTGSASASFGGWSGTAEGQLDRSHTEYRSSDRYRLRSAYADRVQEDRFLRLGYFTPSLQGLSRQPRGLVGMPEGTLGLMYGSSDTLAVNSDQPSATPIYVTPSRPATVEVYRDGALLYSQPVQAGLQTVDTHKLPGGIYSVEVRVVEDGRVAASSEAFVYKPTQWRDTQQRWRYNLYAGQAKQLLTNWQYEREGGFNAGLIGNYLLHPTAILGASLEHLDGAMQYGLSLDWSLHNGLRTYANVYRTDGRGNGLDVQATYTYGRGNLVASHSRAWMFWRTTSNDRLPGFFTPQYRRETQRTEQSALAWQHQVTPAATVSGRVSYDQGAVTGTGMDVSWIQRAKLLGTDATWTLSLFDRPGGYFSEGQRDRGVDLSLTVALGRSGSSLYGSVGTRTGRDGQRERTAALNYQQRLSGPFLTSVAGTLNHDSYGLGVGGRATFENRWLAGDGYLQTSSYNGETGGGLNLSNVLAFGENHLAVSGDMAHYQAGMVVDVVSELEGASLTGYDGEGNGGRLRPGRNLLQVAPYRPGRLHLRLQGEGDEPVSLAPQVLSYHVNKGGVAYQKVFIRRTVTVVGRLLDEHGQPLRGATVKNHASRSVSESDGFFAVEMSRSTPTLDVRKGNVRCFVNVNTERAEQGDDVLLVGDLPCVPKAIAGGPGDGGEDA